MRDSASFLLPGETVCYVSPFCDVQESALSYGSSGKSLETRQVRQVGG